MGVNAGGLTITKLIVYSVVIQLLVLTMIIATVVGFESMSTRNNINSRSTFGTDIRIGNDTADYEQQEPEIEVAGNGNIYVVWEDFREGNWDIFFSRSITNGINWKINLPVIDNNPIGSYQRDPTLAINPNNFLYLAYEENRNGDCSLPVEFDS